MESHPGFRFRSSSDAQRRMAERALTLLRLRADTPPGQWLARVHTDYRVHTDDIAPIDPDGTGVPGPEELAL